MEIENLFCFLTDDVEIGIAGALDVTIGRGRKIAAQPLCSVE